MNPRLKPKTCTTCSTIFTGGSTAKYCPSCRAERIRQHDRERHQRKLAGTLRKIGSIDLCANCGTEYEVKGGYQKYCEPCIIIKNKQSQRESFKRQYYGDPIKRQAMLNRSQQWAANNPDRVKDTSHRHYLNNTAEINNKRRIRCGVKLRPLGRMETCPRCNNNFTVHERNQKYCIKCKE
jgi:hypothetical protein